MAAARRILSRLSVLVVTLAMLSAAAVAWAQDATTAPAEETSDGLGPWLMSYGLVILGIALGVLAVCRRAKRQEVEELDN